MARILPPNGIHMAANVGPRLKALREFYGFSQRELAKRAGVPNSAISVIEQGSVSPSVLSLEKVLNGFPIAIQDFFSIDLERAGTEPQCGVVLSNGGFSFPVGNQLEAVEFQKGSSSQSPVVTIPQKDTLLLVVEGNLSLQALQGAYQLSAGESLQLPSGSPYRISSETDEVRWLLVYTH